MPVHYAANGPVIDDAADKTADFAKGVGKAGADAVKGVKDMVQHPKEAGESIKYAIQHPRTTLQAVRENIRKKCELNRAECVGEMIGNVALVVATDGIGELAEISKLATGAVDAAHVAALTNDAGETATKRAH
jgi:hypothetical protein